MRACHTGDRLERAFVGAATGEVLMFENGEARGSVLVAGGLRITCMLGHAKVPIATGMKSWSESW